MIELISVTNNNVKHFAAVGITAAELPVKDIGTGSTCMMLDTGKKYIYFEGNVEKDGSCIVKVLRMKR